MREIPCCEIAAGSGLPWKLATWGSVLDASLLARMGRKWPTLEECEARWNRKAEKFAANPKVAEQHFGISEGLQLRIKNDDTDTKQKAEATAGESKSGKKK